LKKQTLKYIAYGSNLSIEQMKMRCPSAKIIGKSEIENYRLMFRGSPTHAVATVETSYGDTVPILIWEISREDEKALDRYEGYPFLYHKEIWDMNLNGEDFSAMIYIMNTYNNPYGLPSSTYLGTIVDAYHRQGFEYKILAEALDNCEEVMGYQ